MPTTVQVSDYVKDQLDEIQDAEEHTSMDSTIRALLQDYETDE